MTTIWTLHGVVTGKGHISLKREANSDVCDYLQTGNTLLHRSTPRVETA